MKISDLNYLEVVNPETGSALAGGGDIAFNIFKNVDLNKDVDLRIDKFVNINIDINNPAAFAEADAEAFGENPFAETDAFTYVTENEAFAYSQSSAALDFNNNP
jgi:hypothetical protein